MDHLSSHTTIKAIERQMALNALKRDPKVWNSLPSVLQIDKEFVLTLLQSADELPCKSDFERKFPQSLRFDRDVVLAFTERNDFEQLYYERHLYVPGSLNNDKQVMLAYCRKIPRSLQECSEELCDDREVVEAAIALDGLELQYASTRLQEDKHIVTAACLKDGRALEFCPPGQLRDELTADRSFMLEVLRQKGGPMLRLLAEPLRSDRELLLEALTQGLKFRVCPFDYQHDQRFILEAVARKAEIYLELHKNAQDDPNIARQAICADDSTPAVHERALSRVPALERERQVVWAITKRGEKDLIKKLFLKNRSLADDKEIVLQVLNKDNTLLQSVSERLKRDPQVLLSAMDSSTACDVLSSVPQDVRVEHPELCLKAIQILEKGNMRFLRPHIPNELWHNRHIVTEWIRRGCRILEEFYWLLDDPDFALEVAEHSWEQFIFIQEALRDDDDFMKQAVDRNGRVLRFASERIRNDPLMMVRSVANTSHALCDFADKQAELLRFVQEKLDLHRVFVCEFLRGIAISSPHLPPALRGHLPLLDRGVETSEAFKRLIASFLGAPIGKELALFRKAHRHLNEPMQRPDRDDDAHHRESFAQLVLRRRMDRLVRLRAREANFVGDFEHPLEIYGLAHRRRNVRRDRIRHNVNFPDAERDDIDAAAGEDPAVIAPLFQANALHNAIAEGQDDEEAPIGGPHLVMREPGELNGNDVAVDGEIEHFMDAFWP